MKIFTKKELEEFLHENPKVLDAIKSEIFMIKKHGKDWFKKYEVIMEEERERQLKIERRF